ncbi:hypothetical protein LOTGIDRAFT_162026 [Lottia gigantea]|uniref:Uncharacterized protein n=1 Tax=Lottia gigantea TaxID=225164 RepID=V3ZNQ5_LOTGI|nr:hypothetical protein LOTGIDRAFT_162026 [Lottia gigantea]ESO93003.1 hypothetical protein LOTGIDRAFT_162026 [Lottia gigantea]
MANKFGLGSLPLDTKKPITTAWINKAKPYFVEQIGDTLQGDLDMNNFSRTNLKLPENHNDAVHKKYLMDQLNLIELQQEVTSLKSFIEEQLLNVVDKTQLQPLSSLISNLDDKITKQKIDLKQLIANINPGISEDKLITLETKLIDNSEIQKQMVGIKQQLLNVVDKTQLENLQLLISKLDDKITKLKIDLKQLIQKQLLNLVDKTQLENLKSLISKLDDKIIQKIDNIIQGMNEDELAALETKLNDNSEIDAIKERLDNLVDKTQLESLSSLLSNLDKITKQKIELKQLIDNIKPGISEEKLTELETKLNDNSEIDAIQKQLLNLVDKTQLENLKSLISKLDDKIIQKIDNIIQGMNEDELAALETKLNDNSEIDAIKERLDNLVDKTQLESLSSLLSNLDKITKQKIELKQLIDNIKPGISEEKLTELETKLNDNSEIDAIQKQLLNLVDKTQLENLKSLISKLDDKIIQKIDNIIQGMNEDELAALETKLNDNSEIDAIKERLDNLVDKTQLESLSSLLSNLDKITKQKIEFKQLIDNIKPGISEEKLTELETKLNDNSQIDAIKQQLLNVVDKTQFQNLKSLISNLNDKVTKQKIDLKQLIDNIKPGISEDTWQQESTALAT